MGLTNEVASLRKEEEYPAIKSQVYIWEGKATEDLSDLSQDSFSSNYDKVH